MSDGLYEILALAARYFFAGLFLLIVVRAWRVTVRDGRRARKLRRWSPQTGLSGELVVLEGDGRARRGMRYPVIREGMLGSGRAADIRVRHASVRARHARFELTPEGLALTAVSGAKLRDGGGARARSLLLRDGDDFYAGDVLLSLVLIDASGRAGDYEAPDGGLFDAPRPAAVSETAPEDAEGEAPQDAALEEDSFGYGQGGRAAPPRSARGSGPGAGRGTRAAAKRRRAPVRGAEDSFDAPRFERPIPTRDMRQGASRPARRPRPDDGIFFDSGDRADEDHF